MVDVVGSVAVKVIPETKDFREDARSALRKIRDLEVEARVKPVIDKTAEKRAKDKLDRTFKEINAKVKVNVDESNRLAASARIAILARTRFVTLMPKVSKSGAAQAAATLAALSGARVLDQYASDFREFIGKLDKSAIMFGKVGLALTNLSALALSAGSNLFALSSSLAQIGPAALALPGILGGMAIGVGATIAVFRDFNKVIPELGDKLGELQNKMSDKFWATAEAPIRRLIDNIFPKFAKGITKTSADLGTFFGNLATSFSGKFDSTLPLMFDNLNKSIRIAAGGTDAYAGIIATLGKTGSSYLPRLAKYFRGISEDFDSFLEKADSDGRLQEWIDNGIVQIKELGRFINGLGSAVSGIARAAERAGGASLKNTADSMQRIADTINGKDFQDGLTRALRSSHEAMDAIVDGSGEQFKTLMTDLSYLMTTVMPQAGRTVGAALGGVFEALSRPAISSGIMAMFDGLESGINKLIPALNPLADGLGALGSVVGTFGDGLATVLSPAIALLGESIATVGPQLEPIITSLTKGLGGAIEGLSPAISALADGLASLAKVNSGGIDKFATAFSKLGKGVGKSAAKSIDQLFEALSSITPVFVELATNVLPVVSSVLQALFDIITLVLGAFNGLPGPIKNAIVGAATLALGVKALNVALGGVSSGLLAAQSKTLLMGQSMKEAGLKGLASRGGIAAAGLALTSVGDASEKSGGLLSGFAKVAGGAALGFGVGGPWGAVAGAGLSLLTLGDNSKQAATDSQALIDAQAQLIDNAKTLTSTLDTQTGAIQRATKEMAAKQLAEGGGLKTAQEIGVSYGDITKAALGHDEAIKRVKQRALEYMEEIRNVPGIDSAKVGADIQKLLDQIGANDTAIQAYKEQAQAAKTAIEQLGASGATQAQNEANARKASQDSIAQSLQSTRDNIAEVYNLVGQLDSDTFSPKVDVDLQPLSSKLLTGQQLLTGLDGQSAFPKVDLNTKPAESGAQQLTGLMLGLEADSPEIKAILETTDARTSLKDLVAGIAPEISKGEKPAKTAGKGVGKQAASGVSDARAGFAQAGSFAGQGFVTALTTWIGPSSSAGRSIGRAALDAARAALDINSPSKKFREIGNFVGQGFIQGLQGTESSVRNQVDRLMDLLSDISNKKLRKATKAMVGHYKTQLIEMGKSYDEYALKLQMAQDLIESTQKAISAYGNITQIASSDVGDMVAGLKVARDQAVEFAAAIEKLRLAGGNSALLQDLVSAGPKALDQVKGILAGGGGAITELNSLYDQIKNAGTQVGTTLATSLYGAGVNLADGLINGLKAKMSALDEAMDALADRLVKRIKKQLKIKSPSRVFAAIGGYVTAGFAKGVTDTASVAISSVTAVFDNLQMADVGKSAIGNLLTGMESRYSDVSKSLEGLGGQVGDYQVGINAGDFNKRLASVDSALSTEGPVVKQLNYYAAPGSNQMSSEEELFAAGNRARMFI